MKEKSEKWHNLTMYDKFNHFMRGKLYNMKHGVQQMYMAFQIILEVNSDDENKSENSDARVDL